MEDSLTPVGDIGISESLQTAVESASKAPHVTASTTPRQLLTTDLKPYSEEPPDI